MRSLNFFIRFGRIFDYFCVDFFFSIGLFNNFLIFFYFIEPLEFNKVYQR